MSKRALEVPLPGVTAPDAGNFCVANVMLNLAEILAAFAHPSTLRGLTIMNDPSNTFHGQQKRTWPGR
jgi:hypothetical protein